MVQHSSITQTFSKLYKTFMIAIMAMFIADISNAQTEQKTQQNEKRWDEFSDYMDKITAEELFSGVALIAKGDSPLFEKAFGMADKSQNIFNNIDTKFNLGSISKTFTSVAIAQLVEQKKLSFDDVIKKYIDDFPDEIANKITIEQLLTHTSGLGNIFTPAYLENKDEVETIEEFMFYVVNQPLLFEPGTQHQYSNAGFIVLGYIIEKVSGENYYDYIRKHITKPLGMNDTDFYKKNEYVPNLAHGYTMMNAGSPQMTPSDGQPQRIMRTPAAGEENISLPPPDGQPQRTLLPPTAEERKAMRKDNLSTLPLIGNPSGGAYSTVKDMLKFSSALTRNTLLSKESTNIIMSDKVEARMGAYGYGFEILVENGHRTVGHSGGAPGISAIFRILIDEDYTIIILSNYDAGVRDPYEEIIKRYIMD
jgi:CubicO group peptidase (beta-lactamase class C family)